GLTLEPLRALCDQVVPKTSFSAAPMLLPLLETMATPVPAHRGRGGNARSLPKHLRQPEPAAQERATLVMAGCETHVCLLQTALDLMEQEWDVWVVTDACSSRTERNRDAAFDRLAAAGCELVTTEMVLFEWLESAEHPAFKAVQALLT
ncbi:isochorismatase family protein, partial [Ottowia sp.]|uniref:isochorismatase family protein n=1 Tax=Ottowia sp. TaxID=1898956 RepID=UPI003A8A5AF8